LTCVSKLSDIAEVSAGYPFRGKIEAVSAGSVAVIQMKNIDAFQKIDWSSLIRTELKGKKAPKWLKESDILFLARGNRNYAVYLAEVKEQTLCSPHFFQIYTKDEQCVLPAFLAWQINQQPIQRYLLKSIEGTAIGNIRRSVLESIPIVLPPIEKQLSIIALDNIVKQQQIILEQQIENNHQTMNAIAQQLVHEDELNR